LQESRQYGNEDGLDAMYVCVCVYVRVCVLIVYVYDV